MLKARAVNTPKIGFLSFSVIFMIPYIKFCTTKMQGKNHNGAFAFKNPVLKFP